MCVRMGHCMGLWWVNVWVSESVCLTINEMYQGWILYAEILTSHRIPEIYVMEVFSSDVFADVFCLRSTDGRTKGICRSVGGLVTLADEPGRSNGR